MEKRLRGKLPPEFLFAVMTKKAELLNRKQALRDHKITQLIKRPPSEFHEHAQDEATVQACAERASGVLKRKYRKLDFEDAVTGFLFSVRQKN